MRSSRKKRNIVLKILMGLPFACVGSMLATMGIIEARRNNVSDFGESTKYFLKNDNGKPLRLDLSSGTLAVVMDNAFTPEAKQYTTDAIKKLNNILPNTTVKLYNQKDYDGNFKYIYLNLVEQDAINNGGGAGITHLTYNATTAVIDYPINISLDKKYIDCFVAGSNHESVFSTIVQHELGHALGLKDLTLDDTFAVTKSGYINSVMAGCLGCGTINYSNQDAKNLNAAYGCVANKNLFDAHYVATYPKQIVYTFDSGKHTEEETM